MWITFVQTKRVFILLTSGLYPSKSSENSMSMLKKNKGLNFSFSQLLQAWGEWISLLPDQSHKRIYKLTDGQIRFVVLRKGRCSFNEFIHKYILILYSSVQVTLITLYLWNVSTWSTVALETFLKQHRHHHCLATSKYRVLETNKSKKTCRIMLQV